MIAARRVRNPEVELAEHLDALGRASRLQFGALWALRAATAGLALDALLLLGTRFSLFAGNRAWLAGPPLMLLLIILVAATLHRPNHLLLAQRADRELGLQERLTTAVEIRQQQGDQAFANLQLGDTLAHLRRFRPSQAFPLRAARVDIGTLVIPAAAVLLLALLPVPARSLPTDQARVQETIKQEAERVSALADDIESARTDDDQAARAAVAKALREAGQALGRQPNSAEKAVAALSDAEQELSGMQDMRAEDLRQALARAADALRRETTTRDAGASLAQGDAHAAANSLRSLGGQASGLNAAQRAAAAQALRAAGNNAGRFDARLGESLRRASDALASGDPQTKGALDRAANDLQQAAQATARQDLVEKSLAQLERSRSAIGNSPRGSTAERSEQRGTERQAGAGQQGTQGADSAAKSNAQGDQGGSRSSGDEQGEPGGNSAGKGSLERSTRVFDPNALNSRQEQIASPEFERPSVSTSERTSLPDQGESLVDYRDVYATYRDRATAATQDRYIPLDLKELVKGYFSSLDPSR